MGERVHVGRERGSMRLVDLKTLARQVSISVHTLRKYRRQGMPHYNLGRKILVDPEEFQVWMEATFKVCRGAEEKAVGSLVNDVLSRMRVKRTGVGRS